MGNNESKQENKLIMNLVNQRIVLIKELNMNLTIGQLQVFPHGLDGLKLWDAGIVLSRYVILNCDRFLGKDVLELGSGVGIGGLCVKKWTQCRSVMMSDYHPGVVKNIGKNCVKNGEPELQCVVLDWRERDKLGKQFDLIIGSDIVYFGCPVKDLYEVFKKFLRVGGRGIIVIPDRKNYAELFTKQIEGDLFDFEVQELTDSRYSEPVLQDVGKSQKQYSLLKSIKFYVYHLIKK